MKLKYYLRGIGIGVFVTTVIFMVSISLHKTEADTQNTDAPEDLSMTVEALENSTQKSQTPESLNSDEGQKNGTGLTEPAPKPPEGADNSQKPEKKKETDARDSAKGETKKRDQVHFEVKSGEFSDTVCRKLAEAGLVDDAAAFNRFLIEKDYDDMILPGVYDIPKDATYEEIAALLTIKRE